MKINFFTQKNVARNKMNTSRIYKYNLNSQANKDVFVQNNISFKAQYSTKDIELAKKYMDRADDSWKEEMYNEEYQDNKKNGYIEWNIPAHNGSMGGKTNLNHPVNRVLLDIMTLGLTETVVQAEYAQYRKDARRHVDEIDLIIADLINAKLNEKEAESIKKQQEIQRQVEYLATLNKVEDGELYPKLLAKIQAKKEGKNVEIPNCVMLSNEDDDINKELINWTLQQANANCMEVSLFDDEDFDLVEFLEQMEENYQKTKDWNLIYVKDLDKAINPSEVEDAVIASMKSIMCSTEKDYHSTLIFSSTNPEELDDTAIETNRVTRINSQELVSIKEMENRDIEKRLKDIKYIQNSPLSAINDLSDYVDANTNKRLDFYSTQEDVDNAIAEILSKMTKYQMKHFKPILENAKDYAWYCTMKMPAQDDNSTLDITQKSQETQKKGLDAVIGMDSLKKTLYEEVINPIKNPQKYIEYGINNTINGFLLYGPPGCGKTFIIKKLAEELNRYYVEIKPSDVGSMYQHETAKNIREKFNLAINNAPSIIFIDEIESIAPVRANLSGGGNGNDINEQVTELLQQMNNCNEKDVIIMCASNEPQKIDGAVKRTGRLDKKIFVPNPDVETRYAIIENKLKSINKKDEIDINLIAQNTDYYTAKDIEMLLRDASIKAMRNETNLTTQDIMDAIANYKQDLSYSIVEQYRKKGEM